LFSGFVTDFQFPRKNAVPVVPEFLACGHKIVHMAVTEQIFQFGATVAARDPSPDIERQLRWH
jgi:hypothetical protein